MNFTRLFHAALIGLVVLPSTNLFAEQKAMPKATETIASTPTPVFPGAEWQRPSPSEAAAYDKMFAEAKAYYDELGGTAAMIIKDGIVIAEWGDVARVSNLHSIRKSILTALVGAAVERKQIDLSKTLEELGIDDNEPSLTPEEKKATVDDLIKARSGVYHPALYETESMKKARPQRGSHAPGTFFYYNNWDFNALGTIFERATGDSIFEALDRDIAKPIRMQDYTPSNGKYVRGADSNHPAYPIFMSARDLGRFALLYLNNGRWNGKQILSEAWVKESVRPYSTNPQGGYGYMWWTSDSLEGPHAIFPGAYHAAGAGGQSAWVIPSRQLVIIHRVDTSITEKRVKGTEIEKLVGMIVSALDK